ncbi:Carbohydrate sulfotransferase 14 [Porphyridium purpureum]|uniref:Carbohydrate sulfotransferase 14 n=1 Tax=Porphyridium purpureum TaxID=35688 RepID=A0A5J4Z5Z4_PORPP|nr:Carbohydrate sulfotransferase 14 [Porphyridium purpureum]|eukprot:POR4923..scf295_1
MHVKSVRVQEEGRNWVDGHRRTQEERRGETRVGSKRKLGLERQGHRVVAAASMMSGSFGGEATYAAELPPRLQYYQSHEGDEEAGYLSPQHSAVYAPYHSQRQLPELGGMPGYLQDSRQSSFVVSRNPSDLSPPAKSLSMPSFMHLDAMAFDDFHSLPNPSIGSKLLPSPKVRGSRIGIGANAVLKFVSLLSVVALTIRVMTTTFDGAPEGLALRTLRHNTESFVLIPSPSHYKRRLSGEWRTWMERRIQAVGKEQSPLLLSYLNVKDHELVRLSIKEEPDVQEPVKEPEAKSLPVLGDTIGNGPLDVNAEDPTEAKARRVAAPEVVSEPESAINLGANSHAPEQALPVSLRGIDPVVKTGFGWVDMSPAQQAALREDHGSAAPSVSVDVAALERRGVIRRLIYSEKANMIFCPIPKVANSAWKYLIRKMNGLNDGADIQVVNNRKSSGLEYLDSMPLDDAEALLKDPKIMKVVFVRNPYTRAVSGFNNKFVEKALDSSEYATFVYQLFGYRFFKAQNLTPQEYGRVSFREFVSRVEGQESAEMNEHWAPQTYLCGLDMIQYDFQGRFENMGEDSGQVLNMLGFPGLSLPKQHEIGFLGTSELASGKSWFDTELALKMQTKFESDFTAFSYDRQVPSSLGGTVGAGAGEAGAVGAASLSRNVG